MVAGALRLPTLTQPITVHHGWRQTQTAATIRNFSRFGVDFLRPEVPIFGRRSVVVYEFPLFQALAAQVTRFSLSAEMSGRLIGLVSLLVSGALTSLVARRFVSSRAALVAAAVMVFSPFSLFWGSSVMIEYFVLALVLATSLALFRWNESHHRRWLATATATGCLAAVVKFSTIVPWMILFGAVLWSGPGTRRRRLLIGAATLGPISAAGLAWSLWADHVKMAVAATRPLATSGMIHESLNAMHRLGSWAIWRMPVRTIALQQLGVVGLVAVVGALLSWSKEPRKNQLLLAALFAMPIAAVVTFPVQYAVHDYYSAALAPIVALLVAKGVQNLSSYRPVVSRQRLGVGVVAGYIVALCAILPVERAYAANRFLKVRLVDDRAAAIRVAVRKGGVLGVLARTWNPSLSYLLDRDVSIAWEPDSIAVADWYRRGVRDVAIDNPVLESVAMVQAPWIGSGDPVSLSLGATVAALRSPTIASMQTMAWRLDPGSGRAVDCGRRGVTGPLPSGPFVVRPERAGTQAVISFGDASAIPIQAGAVVWPDRQPNGAQLVCPLAAMRLRVFPLSAPDAGIAPLAPSSS